MYNITLGVYYYHSGDKYEGEFHINLRHGLGKITYSNGESYDG